MLKSESESVLDPRCSTLSTGDTVSETLCAHIYSAFDFFN